MAVAQGQGSTLDSQSSCLSSVPFSISAWWCPGGGWGSTEIERDSQPTLGRRAICPCALAVAQEALSGDGSGHPLPATLMDTDVERHGQGCRGSMPSTEELGGPVAGMEAL